MSMLHSQIREARIQHNLSQAKLARLAGVPRGTLAELENGGNFTRDTLLKVLAHLPQLKALTLGPVTVDTTPADTIGLRTAVEEMMRAGRRALAILDAAEQRPAPAGATRVDSSGVTPELERRVRELEAQVQTLPSRRSREN